MKRLWKYIIFFAFLLWTAVPSEAAFVLHASIDSEIDDITASYVQEVLDTAVKENADAVVFSINTPGGRVDAATRIRDAIMSSPVYTIAYVSPRAWSAGALIAMSSKDIYMMPGASIGAAEPIPATEKNIAALRAEFQSTAARTGRNEAAAGAMVDKTMGFPPYVKKGQILALTASQAADIHISAGTADSVEDVISQSRFSGDEIRQIDKSDLLKVMGFLKNPFIECALVVLVFMAMFAEIKMAGVSGGSMLAALVGILLIGSQWYLGNAVMLEMLLYFGGILLILTDVMLFGTGAAVAAGMLFIAAGLYFTLGATGNALLVVSAGMIGAFVLFLLIAQYLPENRLWKKFSLSLSSTAEKGYIPTAENYEKYKGKKGVAKSILRPAGIAVIDGEQINVVTEGEFAKPGEPVEVIKVSGNRVVVRPIRN